MMSPSSRRFLVPAILIGFLIVLVVLRARSYSEPYEYDLAIYSIFGHELLQGKPLYSYLWDLKPPAIFVTFAAAEIVGGFGLFQRFLLNIVSASATLLGLYFLGTLLAKRRLTGVLAAFFWLVVSGDLALQGQQANVEAFMNAFIVWGVFFFLLGLNPRKTTGSAPVEPENPGLNWSPLFGAGLCFGLAACYKQIIVVIPAALAVHATLILGTSNWRRSLGLTGILLMPGVAFWGLTAFYFGFVGRFQDFYEAVVVIGKWYAQDRNAGTFNHSWHTPLPQATLYLVPPVILWLASVIAGHQRRQLAFGICWLISTVVVVCLPNKFHPHYFQLYLPVACALGALGATNASRLLGRQNSTALRFVPVVLATIWLVAFRAPDFRLSSEQTSLFSWGNRFVHMRNLCQQLKPLIPPGSTMYVYGLDAEFYMNLRANPASGIMIPYPLLNGPFTEKMNRRLVRDLRTTKPQYIIVDVNSKPTPALSWIIANYKVAAKEPNVVLLKRISNPRE